MHGTTNSSGNRNNWNKLALYPEHKNKHKDFIVKEDMKKNHTFINNVLNFEKNVERWSSEQIWINKNRVKNKSRTKKTLNELKDNLDRKRIIQTYTLTENAIFLRNNFGENIEKINRFFEIALDSWLESASVPKEQVISAIVHHDQSTPHLHIAISALYEKEFKEFNKMLLTSNSKIFNIYHNLSLKKYNNIKEKTIKKRSLFANENDIETYFQNETNNYRILGETMDLIQSKYEDLGQSVYDTDRDIRISHIRGFDNNFLKNMDNSIEYNKFKNKIIFSYRISEANGKFEKFKTTEDAKDFQKYQFMEFKKSSSLNKISQDKEYYLNNPDEKLSLFKHEEAMLAKINYYKRIEIDLGSIGTLHKLNELKFNNIEKNRFYNDVLYFCNEKKLFNNLEKYTPQDLSKEMYSGTYKFQRIENQRFKEIESTIFADIKLMDFDIPINKLNFNEFEKIKDSIEINLPEMSKNIKNINLWFHINDIDLKENFSQNKLGINTVNIENIAFAYKAKRINKNIDSKPLGKNKNLNIGNPSFNSQEKTKMAFSNFENIDDSKWSNLNIERNKVLFLKQLYKNGEKIDDLAKYYGYHPEYIHSLVNKEIELGIDMNL